LTLIGYDLPGFIDGVFVALAGVLLFIFIMEFISLIFRRKEKKCYSIFADSEKGKLYISTAAIADLVKSKESEVSGITVIKTYLAKRKKTYFIKIETELINDNEICAERIAHLQNKVLSAINDNLGIKSIEKVDIIIKRIRKS
jgi:hypothetical protein